MPYKLTYRIARQREALIPTVELGLFSEQVEENLILSRMKEVQNEHRANVENVRGLPQFALFFPIENVA
jgi:hypothetical protein